MDPIHAGSRSRDADRKPDRMRHGNPACDRIDMPEARSGRYAGVFLWADLDGTLLTPERSLSPENLEAIGAFQAQGGRFGIATGRMEKSTSANFPSLRTNLPCIFYNGALIGWHPEGASIRSTHLSRNPADMLDDVIRAFPEVGIEVLSAGRAWMVRRNPALEAQLARERLEAVDARWTDIPAGWFKVLLGGEPAMLAEVTARLGPMAAGRFDLVRSEQTLLEVLQPGVSKGDAVRWVAARAEPSPNRIVAIGDNDNDADMLAAADLGIVMANGSPAAKRAASVTIADNRTPCMPAVLALLDAVRQAGRTFVPFRRAEGPKPASRACHLYCSWLTAIAVSVSSMV